MERTIALILHDIETIQNPYAVLIKSLVQKRTFGDVDSYSAFHVFDYSGHEVYTIGNTLKRRRLAMSKTLSLKMRDEVFSETEEVIVAMHISRNAYINDALSFYNKFMKRSVLKKLLKKESALVSESSLEALRELELIEDRLPK